MTIFILGKATKYISVLVLLAQFCFSQVYQNITNEHPCIVIPDSLKISYHSKITLGYLYKKNDSNEIVLARSHVSAIFDSNKNMEINFLMRTDLFLTEYNKYPNSYLAPQWLEYTFYQYIKSYPQIISNLEELQIKRHEREGTRLYYYSLNLYSCPCGR